MYLSKSFLLDVIADSKLPSNLEPYILLAEVATTTVVTTKPFLDDDEDGIVLTRQRDAKRGRASLEDAPEPEAKKRAELPPPSSISSKVTIASSSSTPVKQVTSIATVSALVGLPELPFPAITSSLADDGVAPVSYGSVSMKWSRKEGTLLCFSDDSMPGRARVASFDMDHTIIMPKSNGKFPTNRADWKWAFPEVPKMLKRLHSFGYKIVIFSNQGGIKTGKQKESDITGKIQDICTELDIPIQAFCATDSDQYRKPSPFMWKLFVKSFNAGVPVDHENSFYIGDAAGRAVNWAPSKKADHGVGDRKFAVNAGLPFQTPEEFFLGHAAVPFFWRSNNPLDILTAFASDKDPKIASKHSALQSILSTLGKKQELILMVGIPASGKSTFAIRHLEPRGYHRVNRDTLGTPAKCLTAVKTALGSGKSAVVDNTNPSASARSDYIKVAKGFGVPVRVLWMETPESLADHCNLFREKLNGTRHVPDIAYNMYRKNFAAPDASEGIVEIMKVPWIPDFDSDVDRSIFLQWTE